MSQTRSVVSISKRFEGKWTNICLFCIWRREEADQCQGFSCLLLSSTSAISESVFSCSRENQTKQLYPQTTNTELSSSLFFLLFFVIVTAHNSLSACTEGLNITCSSSSNCTATILPPTNPRVMITGRQCLCSHLQRKFPDCGERMHGVVCDEKYVQFWQ